MKTNASPRPTVPYPRPHLRPGVAAIIDSLRGLDRVKEAILLAVLVTRRRVPEVDASAVAREHLAASGCLLSVAPLRSVYQTAARWLAREAVARGLVTPDVGRRLMSHPVDPRHIRILSRHLLELARIELIHLFRMEESGALVAVSDQTEALARVVLDDWKRTLRMAVALGATIPALVSAPSDSPPRPGRRGNGGPQP